MSSLLHTSLAPQALEKLLINRPLMAGAVLGSLLLGACASTPVPPSELLQARQVVHSANTDREVQTYAPLELKQANDTLRQADRLLENGTDLDEVSSAAYIARRQAQTAVAIAQAKGADAAIAGAELERERTRADMRTREADQAQVQTGAAQSQARRARAQATASDERASGAEIRADLADQRASGALMQVAMAQAGASEAQANAVNAEQRAAALQLLLNDLQAKPTERGMLVTFGDVLFEFNRADIKPGAQAGLVKLADFLRQYPGRNILIEGHTDSIGSAAANEALSRRRANAVDGALVSMGVAGPRVASVGYGKDYPVADNSTDTNRALNRRVEVYIGDPGQTVRTRR